MAVPVARSLLLVSAIALVAASPPKLPRETAKPPAAAAKPSALIVDAGRDRVMAVCSGCHDPKTVIGQHHDRDGWGDVLDRMEGHGAKFSDADYATITGYLAKHY